MPYINQDDREDLHYEQKIPANAGELNYLLTTIIDDYFMEHGGRYAQVNDIIGALEGAKLEFYRRIVAPYEDVKLKENGEVYLSQGSEEGY